MNKVWLLRSPTVRTLAIALIPAVVQPVSAEPETGSVVRFVSLRDGSTLRVNLSDAPAFEWDQKGHPIGPEEIAEAILSPVSAGGVIREIHRNVEMLGSVRFVERETASRWLLSTAPGFGALLSEIRAGVKDLEVITRLDFILEKNPPRLPADPGFDLLVTRDGRRLTGDIGDWSATVVYRGFTLKLSRENVLKISSTLPEFSKPVPLGGVAKGTGGIGGFERVENDDDGLLPPDLYRTDFESDPAGIGLKIGDDISRRFAAAGFEISTSVEGAIVSVNDFAVQGRSKGLSAATHSPLWEGTLTVRFHAPGNPEVPAFVTAAGFWVASVSPGGTRLEAFDPAGGRVGTVITKSSGNEFLAFRSHTPIAYLKIIPDDDIDRNYTIDDLFFTRPVPHGIRAEPGWGVFQTRGGERFLARNFDSDDRGMILGTLSFGAGEVKLDRSELAAFAPPPPKIPPAPGPIPKDLHWVMLKDGSRLRATRDGFTEHRWSTSTEFILPGSEIAALWGKGQSPIPPPADKLPFLRDSKGFVTRNPLRPNSWLSLRDATLGENWIESLDRITARPAYGDSYIVWLAAPPEPNPTYGRITLSTGDQITISPGTEGQDTAMIQEISSEIITLGFAGKSVAISMGQVSSIHFPEPEESEP